MQDRYDMNERHIQAGERLSLFPEIVPVPHGTAQGFSPA